MAVKSTRGGRRAVEKKPEGESKVKVTQNADGSVSTAPLQTFDDNDANALRTANNALYDPDVTAAIKNYISNNNPNGDGFSHSQNLNYKLDNAGGDASKARLNATEQYIYDNIRYGMHDIGKRTSLERYCHFYILKAAGISNYSKMSGTQLQKALVGKTLTTTSFMSTSYNGKNSPFHPSQPGGNGREVVLKVNTKKSTKMVFGTRKQSEIILDMGTQMKVSNVYYDGSTAYPRNSGAKPRVVIELECLN